MFTDEQTAAMKAPLNAGCIKTREQGGKTLSYIEGWKVIDEANRIFGFDGWSRETIELQQTNRDLVTVSKRDGGSYEQWRIGYIARVRITVGTVVREGTGYGSGMGKPEGVGDAVEGAIKEAETDAMKRAFMTFGNPFGLALYDKSQANVEKDEPKQKAPAKPKRTPEELAAGWLVWAQGAVKAITGMTPEQLRGWEAANDKPLKGLAKHDAALLKTVQEAMSAVDGLKIAAE